MTNFTIYAVAIADGQLSIAHSVDCPAVRAGKRHTGAHSPRSRHRSICPEVLESASVNPPPLVVVVGRLRQASSSTPGIARLQATHFLSPPESTAKTPESGRGASHPGKI